MGHPLKKRDVWQPYAQRFETLDAQHFETLDAQRFGIFFTSTLPTPEHVFTSRTVTSSTKPNIFSMRLQ